MINVETQQAEEAQRVTKMSDDALLAECAQLARERKQILAALLSEKDRRLGEPESQPPIWQLIGQYSLAMSQMTNGSLSVRIPSPSIKSTIALSFLRRIACASSGLPREPTTI